MRRKILAAVLAVVMAAACAAPAMAATGSSNIYKNKLDEAYHDLVETPSKYLTVDYATLLKDARAGDLTALAKDFNVNVIDVTEPTPDLAAMNPAKPGAMEPAERAQNFYIADLTKMNFNDITNKADIGLKPVVINYEEDGSMRAYIIILNKTDHDIVLNGIDAIQLLDDNKKIFAGGQNLAFATPLTVQGNETPWFLVLNFQPGTYVPGTSLNSMKNPRIQYYLRY